MPTKIVGYNQHNNLLGIIPKRVLTSSKTTGDCIVPSTYSDYIKRFLSIFGDNTAFREFENWRVRNVDVCLITGLLGAVRFTVAVEDIVITYVVVLFQARSLRTHVVWRLWRNK